MATQRNSYSAEFKARVALEALKGHKTINELVSHFGVHPTQINKWKNHLLTELPHMFSNRHDKREQDHEALQAQLYQQIGQLKVELDWLKKIWTWQLMPSAPWSSLLILNSVSLGSVNFWACRARPTTTARTGRVQRICMSCACWTRNIRRRRIMAFVA